MRKRAALFSGRFDVFNLGHVLSLAWLLRKYDKVIVCILDYPERKACSITITIDILKTFLVLWTTKSIRERIIVTTNKTHFAKITIGEIKWICESLNCDLSGITYVGGNKVVNRHIRSLDVVPVEFLPRILLYNSNRKRYEPSNQFLLESTRIREKIKKGQPLGIQYNIDIEDKH